MNVNSSPYAAKLNRDGSADVWDVCNQAFLTVHTVRDYGRVYRTVEQERDVVTRHLLGPMASTVDMGVSSLKDESNRPLTIGLFEYMKRRHFAAV